MHFRKMPLSYVRQNTPEYTPLNSEKLLQCTGRWRGIIHIIVKIKKGRHCFAEEREWVSPPRDF
jgi:hypothetical protein